MSGIAFQARLRLGDFQLDAAFSGQAQVVGVFGPSGSGKTTILRLIAGLLTPDEGRIVLDGRVVFDSARKVDLRPRERRVGLVFQDGLLFPHMTVRQNLLYGAWVRHVSDPERFRRTVDVLGIAHLLDRAPRHLSGGEKQRVAIGRALLADPAVLLMDEPVAALDQQRRAEILPFIETLIREPPIPLLYVSHALEEIERLADEVVFLNAGRVVETKR